MSDAGLMCRRWIRFGCSDCRWLLPSAESTVDRAMNNWRKHREDQGQLQRTWKVDPFSSGAQFGGWKELEGQLVMWPLRETYDPLVVYLPTTWLLTDGWQVYGLIGTREVPSMKRVAA